MVLVERQTNRSMKQNKEFRNGIINIRISEKGEKAISGKRIIFSTNGAETTGLSYAKEKEEKKKGENFNPYFYTCNN